MKLVAREIDDGVTQRVGGQFWRLIPDRVVNQVEDSTWMPEIHQIRRSMEQVLRSEDSRQ